MHKSTSGYTQPRRFRIAFSFAGEKREFVAKVARILADRFGEDSILYDKFHEAEFARYDLGIRLPHLYGEQSELVVPVFCPAYDEKRWTGWEWAHIYGLFTKADGYRVMLSRFARAEVVGLSPDATFIELDKKTPEQFASHILERLALNEGLPKDHYTKPTPHDTRLAVTDDIDWKAFFVAPEFQDTANRVQLQEQLVQLIRGSPVCVIGGLSGSGKTVLVASGLRRLKSEGLYSEVLWHEPMEGETLDSLLTKMDPRTSLPGLSTAEKAKRLLAQVVSQGKVLVIDDFHQVDRTTYQSLVIAAARTMAPARLIIISQINIGLQGTLPAIPHLTVPGLTISELEAFLKAKSGLRLPALQLADLHTKTEGLALAIELFTVLVELGSSPESLLKGNMLGRERLKTWFQRVEKWGGYEQSMLLQLLSLCDGPFNMGVAQMLCRHASLSCAEDIFENLQRRYLIQQYSPYRWKVHHLVKTLCNGALSASDQREAHAALGRYFLKTARRIAMKYSAVQTFLWRVQASSHLRYGGEYEAATRNLCALAKHAKSNGYYDLFLHLASAIPDGERRRDKWLTYHMAHCYLITGRLKAGLKLTEELAYDTTLELNLRISSARLYAEVQEAIGNPKEGLVRLREAITAFADSKAPKNLLDHLVTVEIRLLTAVGEFGAAEQKCRSQVEQSLRGTDLRAQAIALTSWGIVCEATDRFEMAEMKLRDGAVLFNQIPDYRGFAWSLSHQAYCLLRCGEHERASGMLCTALKIKGDIQEASVEYERFLNVLGGYFNDAACQRLISSELARVRSRVADMQQREQG